MSKYYKDASPEEVAEAVAALGVKNYGHNSTTAAAAIVGNQVRDILGNLVEPTYTSDPSTHAANLDQLNQMMATPEPEPFNARNATNAEFVDYCARNGISIGSQTQAAARIRPDERPSTRGRIDHNEPHDQPAA